MPAGENPALWVSIRGVTSSSNGEGRRSAVESAPWFKASEQGSSILPFATRVFIIFVIVLIDFLVVGFP